MSPHILESEIPEISGRNSENMSNQSESTVSGPEAGNGAGRGETVEAAAATVAAAATKSEDNKAAFMTAGVGSFFREGLASGEVPPAAVKAVSRAVKRLTTADDDRPVVSRSLLFVTQGQCRMLLGNVRLWWSHKIVAGVWYDILNGGEGGCFNKFSSWSACRGLCQIFRRSVFLLQRGLQTIYNPHFQHREGKSAMWLIESHQLEYYFAHRGIASRTDPCDHEALAGAQPHYSAGHSKTASPWPWMGCTWPSSKC